MDFKLSETKVSGEATISIYSAEGSSYILKKRDYTTYSVFDIWETESNEYLPTIYVNENMDGHIESLDIQTTSYGAVGTEEMDRIIEGYKMAVDTVRALENLLIL